MYWCSGIQWRFSWDVWIYRIAELKSACFIIAYKSTGIWGDSYLKAHSPHACWNIRFNVLWSGILSTYRRIRRYIYISSLHLRILSTPHSYESTYCDSFDYLLSTQTIFQGTQKRPALCEPNIEGASLVLNISGETQSIDVRLGRWNETMSYPRHVTTLNIAIALDC